jgi:zona occludens toxin (predicted ATPase)
MSAKPMQEKETVSWGQKIFDNVWLLFLLSLLISTLIYNVWGIVDLLNIPPAP